jgi:hypothetical protein
MWWEAGKNDIYVHSHAKWIAEDSRDMGANFKVLEGTVRGEGG